MKFSLRDLIIVTSVVGAVLGLAVIGIRQARMEMLQTACENRQREFTYWTTANASVRLPNFSTQGDSYANDTSVPVPPHQMIVGDTASKPSAVRGGFGWLTDQLIRLEMEEEALWQLIRDKSQRRSLAPFNPSMTLNSGQPIASKDIPAFRCPMVKKQVAGAIDYPVGSSPAVGSYFAFAGSHLDASGRIVRRRDRESSYDTQSFHRSD